MLKIREQLFQNIQTINKQGILTMYERMLKYYEERGVGTISELYNTRITAGLIDTIRKRYDELRQKA